MQIRSITPKLINYNQIQKSKSVQNNFYSVSKPIYYKNTPAAFCGIPKIKKVNLPNALKNLCGEIYKIKVYDKIKKQEINAFLNYKTSIDAPNELIGSGVSKIQIYNEEAEEIGSVNMDFDMWKKSFYEFLSHNPYTQLNSLENKKFSVYSRVGGNLIQAAIEKSLQTEAKGRIFLFASNNINTFNDPFIFYHKMGFSLENSFNQNRPAFSLYLENALINYSISKKTLLNDIKALNEQEFEYLPVNQKMFSIYQAVSYRKGLSLDEIYLKFCDYMYLHNYKVKDFWLAKIKNNPIFCESNRLK